MVHSVVGFAGFVLIFGKVRALNFTRQAIANC